ncbi:MAG: diaminopimelate epimerase [Firmicutes bacterium]|nr:diaminopimelate epimerase [Bacillota bacterium]
MRFTKMQGIGNDYVYVNGFEEQVDKPSELAKKVSDRHFGIGSDGLILLLPSEVADVRMRMFNADGSEAQMCGNGLRCLAKLAYDSGIVQDLTLTVETLAGIKEVRLLTDERGEITGAIADMGQAKLRRKDIPMAGEPEKTAIDQELTVLGETYTFTGVSMGNPHCVIWVSDLKEFPVEKIGPAIEKHPLFPERVNVEFCQLHSPTEISMRVWERGSGETMACGTGACAAVVAGVESGRLEREVLVHLLGGDLKIAYAPNGKVTLEGPCVTVFTGEYLVKED